MTRKWDLDSPVIAVEEHAWTPELRAALLADGTDETVAVFSDDETTNARLLDLDEQRLARMDTAGVDMQVLSITSPGTQPLPASAAVPLARGANDALAAAVERHPNRFAAFATVPTPDPDAAAAELHRCINELGFVGAMLFPRTGAFTLDDARFEALFDVAARHQVPLYIHPGIPPAAVREACYGGFDTATNLMLATGGWGWHAEAGLAALRLILAGTFDRHPDLQIILGHWGEMLVAFADRADALNVTATHLERPIRDYITANVNVTAGGVFSHRMLRQAVDVLGPDRVMFGQDDPYQGTLGQRSPPARVADTDKLARKFIDTAPLTSEQKSGLAHANAVRLLRLPHPQPLEPAASPT